MKLIDLSHALVQGQASFPGDPPLIVQPHGTVATTLCNTTQITIGTHQGTHLDAMYHCFDGGRTVDRMPLEWFYGPARLLRIPKQAREEITADDLCRFEAYLQPEAKVLLATGWHRHFGAPDFFTDFPSLTLEAGRYLVSRRIRLLGMDMPSPSQQWLDIHQLLQARDVEIVLVEALANLDALPDEFLFIGFPLNFQGRDGSPIRAVAVC